MIFSQVTAAPADPILGLNEAFKADPRNNKIDLGVGIYKDEDGRTPVLKTVKRAEEILLKEESSKNYLGIEGQGHYNKAVQELLFGAQHPVLGAGRAVTAQAPGGTGALRIAAEFVIRNTPSRRVWISNPSWANHRNIFETVGLTVNEYPYYDAAKRNIDFSAMLDKLQTATSGDLVLLHGCCHNPTGIDLNLEQWQQLGQLCADRELIPLVDFAYQGFGHGIEEDAAGLRLLASLVPELLVANSFSKNFGLYNERIGAVTLVAANADEANVAFSQIKKTIRANYSNPPAHGAMIVSTILSRPELRNAWEQELSEMRRRIAEMRILFVESLKSAGVSKDFSFIGQQLGMFSFSGLSPQQVIRLKEEFSVYIVGSGRISVAGMTKSNMSAICEAIAKVLD